MVRQVAYARGGDTTLELYKLQVVAVEECLFAPELRLAAAIGKSNIDRLETGTNSSSLSLFPISTRKPGNQICSFPLLFLWQHSLAWSAQLSFPGLRRQTSSSAPRLHTPPGHAHMLSQRPAQAHAEH